MSSLKDKTVTMAHGAGGRQTSELIDQIFAAHFANPDLTADDAAVLTPPAGKMAVSTDGFIVSPAFFPGGNIGKLSICGTVNDLACMGAKPLYLTCAFVIEEGFPMEKLEEIAAAPYAYLLPAEAAVQDLQELVLTDKQALRITQGVKTTVRDISNGTYRLKTITGDFLGIGSAESELVKAEKILKQFQADAEMI